MPVAHDISLCGDLQVTKNSEWQILKI